MTVSYAETAADDASAAVWTLMTSWRQFRTAYSHMQH